MSENLSDDDQEEWECTPKAVTELPPILQVAAGSAHCLCLTDKGQVHMFGMYEDADNAQYRNTPEVSIYDPQHGPPPEVGHNKTPVLVPLPR
jgi:alpha-tubulin suppressor-like RCC1 family protein